ncbi:hypothetical protein JCM5350_003372 [Sporobolomyces pararoseus]
MFLQSVPSPSGFTRRRPRIAIAFISCLLVVQGLAGEVRTTRPNLKGIAAPQEEEALGRLDITAGKRKMVDWKGELERKETRSIELIPRQAATTSSPSSATSTTTTSTTPSSLAPESTASPSGTVPATSFASVSTSSISSSPISTSTAIPAGYEVPQPFDSTLGTNFSSTACPSFFATFLADPEFISCAPFSLLLGTSSGFFQAQRSPYSLLPYVLNATCSAPVETCSALMDKYARQIKLQNTCGQDLSKGNPLAQEALEGFQNYRLYREVGCQKDNSTEPKYCFADASADSDPDSLYFYYLAEGTSLPSGTVATCDYCQQNLLASYSRYALNATLPISKTYAAGRSVAALTCGPNFAPLVSKTATGSASPSFALPASLVILVLSLIVILC